MTVLIDALIIFEEAGRVVDWIRATGKNLMTIYITHGHGDHFFGLNTILAAFPDARAVTAAAVVPFGQGQVSPEGMGFWSALFPEPSSLASGTSTSDAAASVGAPLVGR